MYLIVDAQALQSPDFRRRGVGRYVRDLVRALAATPGVRVDAVFNTRLPAPDDADLHLTSQVHWFESPLPWSAVTAGADVSFADWLCALAPDVILLPSLFDEAASIPTFMTSRRPLVAAVVYDLIPLVFHRRYLRSPARRALYAARLRVLDRCDLLLAISQATRRDVMRLLEWPGERVATILGAAEPSPLAGGTLDEAAVLRRLSVERPFILYVGGDDRRKNLTGALAAFAALPEAARRGLQFVLVCALTDPQRRVLERVVRRSGIPADAVRLTGYVDDAVLEVLYRRCRLFFFPSYYEGLGLPLLEALRHGAPVVVSNRSSIPEFAGPGARLINPASPAGMAGAIEETLAMPYEHGADERQRFADAFEWKATARLALDAIERGRRVRQELHATVASAGVQPHTQIQARKRPRVAWVSPLPPSASGIADYSAELLAHLADTFDISLVISPGAVVHSSLRRFAVLGPNQAIHTHERCPFDLWIYHVGNHERHVYMLDLMRRYSGLTVLHDVAIGGLALKAQETGEWFGSIAATLETEAGRRKPATNPTQLRQLADAVRTGRADHDRIVRDATLNGPVLARSEAVIVHSASSWQRVHDSADVPVFRVPHGIPAVTSLSRADARSALALPTSAFIVATLGEATATKRLDRILEAVALLPVALLARTTFLVVGPTSPSLASELTARAIELGVGQRVRFTGRVPLPELAVYGCAADVCVQLRYPVRGETSGALLRALSGGSACIVSDAGSFSEVPEEAALRVAPDEREVARLCELFVRLDADPELGRQLRERAVAWARSEHTMTNAARLYAAAMTLTIARRRALDSEWLDAASAALTAAEQIEPDSDRIRGWAEARRRATEVP